MKIFITGSSGFIGTELQKELNTDEIVTYDHAMGEDILDYDALAAKMKGCDVVVHLAAHRKPYEDKTFNDYFKVNCEGTLNVAHAAVAGGVKRLIYTSSTSYYGIEQGIPYPLPIHEGSPVLTQHAIVDQLNCRDCDIAYSTSKVIAEQILANFGLAKKLEVIILRLGPTRKQGEYRPFGEAKLHLKIENAMNAITKAMHVPSPKWYQAFTIMDENPNVDLQKAKTLLGYEPK